MDIFSYCTTAESNSSLKISFVYTAANNSLIQDSMKFRLKSSAGMKNPLLVKPHSNCLPG